MNTVEEVLQNCRVENNVVFLPEVQLDRKLYLQVNQRLEFIGGSWNRKARGFVFEHDPEPLLGRVQGGEQVNLKKEYQFFETPKEIINFMLSHASIREGMLVLEPSAGKGAILRELPRNVTAVACELNPLCYPFLKEEFPRVALIEGDYLETTLVKKFDRIIANPPFSKNQDIAHIMKMYEDCRPGGRIVTVASKHWEFAIGTKENNFRCWLERLQHHKYDIEPGAFKDSGTMVGTTILVIDKDMED
jgi:hypothetical protein